MPDVSSPMVEEFVRVMRSEAMMLVMSQLTGLPLHPLLSADGADSEEDSAEGELQHKRDCLCCDSEVAG